MVLQGNDEVGAGVLLLFRIVRTATLGVIRAADAPERSGAVPRLGVVVAVVPQYVALEVWQEPLSTVDLAHSARPPSLEQMESSAQDLQPLYEQSYHEVAPLLITSPPPL